MFEILVWLLVKHFICDFPLQAHPWLYSRKGDYGAPGGIAHALIHGAGSAVVLAALSIDIQLMTFLVLAEVVAHYHIDWLKMTLNKMFRWGPTGSEKFWILLGADQLAPAGQTARAKTTEIQIPRLCPTISEHSIRRIQYLLRPTSFTRPIHVQAVSN